VRKKINAAAGLVTVATAGALFASTPAYAMEDGLTVTPAVSSSAPATAGQQTSTGTRTLAGDGHRRRHRYRHYRRHHRRHFRHHRHHRRHYRHYRHYRSWY
jgi:hypothetical protein